MKFFDRFFGRNSGDEEQPSQPPESAGELPPVEEAPKPDFREQEHIARALSVLLSLHADRKTEETLMDVLRCLMENPPLWVSMTGNPPVPETTVSDRGEKVLPVFTSVDQVPASYRDGRDWVQLRFLDLKPHVTRAAGLTGILFNGFSHEFLLHRMAFPMFFDAEIPKAPEEANIYRLTPAGMDAEPLKAAAIKFLAAHNCRKAFFGKLNNNGEESYLFAIDQNVCSDSEYFRQMNKELAAIPTNLPIDYTSYESFRKHITPENCQMIFHQGSEALPQ